ncbi:MAG: hypothetical protein KDB82_17765 [Planctomycetes bacterium]|nr:hypothetical protein [Planctomycetota bacterium]
MIEQDEQTVEKITRRYYVKPQDKVTALRDTYRLRRAAIKRFTERLEKTGGFIDEAEIESLRAAGVNEDEIKALVDAYGV